MAELGIPYLITGPDGTEAVLNDPDHPAFVGYLRGLDGLDGADVREASHDLAGMDGASHGAFYQGRRGIQLEGMIWPDPPARQNAREERLQRATLALRADGVLSWQATAQDERKVAFRRQSRLTVRPGRPREFAVTLVCEDPHIYGGRQTIAAGPASAEAPLELHNPGNAEAPATVRISGPVTNPALVRLDAPDFGPQVRFEGLALGGGEFVDLDLRWHTALRNGSERAYHLIRFADTSWPLVPPGTSRWRLEGTGLGVDTRVEFRFRPVWL